MASFYFADFNQPYVVFGCTLAMVLHNMYISYKEYYPELISNFLNRAEAFHRVSSSSEIEFLFRAL